MHVRMEATSGPRALARFVSLPENRAARMAIRRIATIIRAGRPGPIRTLFLHGPTGSGKSHLMAWLQRKCCDHSVTTLIASDWEGPSDEYRKVDLLIVEDIQHLSNRAADSLQRTLDQRESRQRITVLTANRSLADLALPSRFRNRCVSGLVVGIKPLGKRSRRRLIAQFAAGEQLRLAPDVLNWLAQEPATSVRQIRATVQRVLEIQRAAPNRLDLDMIRLNWEAPARRIDVESIIDLVARHYGVGADALRGSDRHLHVALPRQVGMYLAWQCAGLPAAAIGSSFGDRDPSTVRHSCQKIRSELSRDPVLAAAVKKLRESMT